MAGLAWLVCLCGAARGEVLYSGALYDRNQKEASCTVLNVGPSPASVKEVRIVSSDGSPVSVPFDNCKNGAMIQPGRICNVNANMLSSSLLYYCVLDTGGANPLRFRGTLILYDSTLKILATSDLR
jgi:hypothetical protein